MGLRRLLRLLIQGVHRQYKPHKSASSIIFSCTNKKDFVSNTKRGDDGSSRLDLVFRRRTARVQVQKGQVV